MKQNELSKQRTGQTNNQINDSGTQQEGGIRINGYAQILDMLRSADSAFRESLLRRINAQNPMLAKKLRNSLS